MNCEPGHNNKNFALRLALKQELRETQKWPIVVTLPLTL